MQKFIFNNIGWQEPIFLCHTTSKQEDLHDPLSNYLYINQRNNQIRLFIDVPSGTKLSMQYTYDSEDVIRKSIRNVEWINHEVGTITSDFVDMLNGPPTAIRLKIKELPTDQMVSVEIMKGNLND